MVSFCLGVEFAGELRDYLEDVKKVYPEHIINNMTISLVNSHYKVLSMYDQQVKTIIEILMTDGRNF